MILILLRWVVVALPGMGLGPCALLKTEGLGGSAGLVYGISIMLGALHHR
jgi:hypothetical protein